MFGKDKVKGHNRLIKSKKGLKVTRVGNFLRKKDKNEKRNLAIGIGATAALGIGAGLLLRKKGIKLPTKGIKKNPINENVVIPKQAVNSPSPGEKFIAQMDEELKILPDTAKAKTPVKVAENTVKPSTGKKNDMPELKDFWNTKNTPGTRMLEKGDRLLKVSKRASGIRKKTGFSKISDPWSTPIKTKIDNSYEMIVEPKSKGMKLLSAVKTPNPRGNLLKSKGTTGKDRVISRLVDGYATLPLPMKVTLQMEKALRNPIRSSNVGRPPDTKGLKAILDDGNKAEIDIVISRAKRKIETRLKRQIEESRKKQLDDIVPSPSRRGLLGVEKVKATLAQKDKLATIAVDALAERKSPMGKAIQQINKIAKDPEAEKLGIQVRAEEWEKALATVTSRRGAIRATGKGVSEAAQSLAYARVVKPKIIKTLMGELKSGNLQTTNPKGYAERLQRIHNNFDELMVKEGTNYRELSRRELGKRVGKVMQPEIDDAVNKAKDFATDSNILKDVFFENAQMQEAFKQAGVQDKKAQFLLKMLMKVGGLG